MIFEDFLVKQNALILRVGENRHPTLNSSLAKSFCSTRCAKKTEPKKTATELVKTTQTHVFCYEHKLQSMTFWFLKAKHQTLYSICRDDVILKHARNESISPSFIFLLGTLIKLKVFSGNRVFSWFHTRMSPKSRFQGIFL